MLPEMLRYAKRILAVRLDNIGDVVMLGPALRTLRAYCPEAGLVLMASPSGAQAAPLLPWVDDVFVYRAPWQDVSGTMSFGASRERALRSAVRKARYDAAFIFTSFSQSPYPPACVLYQSGVPVRVGQSREFGGCMLTHWVRPLSDDAHQVDRNLHLLEQTGFEPGDRRTGLRIPDAAAKTAEGMLREAGVAPGERLVVLAPGASCGARRCSPKRFGEAVRLIVRSEGVRVAVVGTAGESPLAETVRSAAPHGAVIDLTGKTTVPQTAAVIDRAEAVIANNSGCMHIADALGRPNVIVFSGANLPSQWVPRNSDSRVLTRPTDCSPCYRFECRPEPECLEIDPVRIADACIGCLRKEAPATAGGDMRSSRVPGERRLCL